MIVAAEVRMQDLRLACRSLVAAPIVSAVAILSIALGIGANTAIFSLINALLLRPLPVSAPDGLVSIAAARSQGRWTWSYAVWDQIRQRPQLFDGTVAWSADQFNLTAGGEAHFVNGLWASGSFFSTLGVAALRGRTFTSADDTRGAGPDGPVTVISYGFWQRHFAGAADAVGRRLMLDNVPFTVVGVTPPEFFGLEVGQTFDVIVPIGDEPLLHGPSSWLDQRGNAWLTIMARLKRGQALADATAALRATQRPIWEATVPRGRRPQAREQYLNESFVLLPAATGESNLRRAYETPIKTIFVVVALVLLIACANVANLMLARGTARRHEMSVRVAIGASRWRLVRQMLAESTLIAALGTALGLAIATWGTRLVVDYIPSPRQNWSELLSRHIFLDLVVDWRVLAFTTALTIAATVLFGLVPALRASNVAPMEALKEHGRSTAGDARFGLATALVVAQVTVSVVLVVAAGLFGRTFTSLTARHAGFERDPVLLVNLDAERANVAPAQRAVLFDRIREAVHALPGVHEAAVSIVTPISGNGLILRADVAGGAPLPDDGRGALSNAYTNIVSPGWFETFGVPVLAGRDFSERDRVGAPAVAIVNQTLARKTLNGGDVLGRSITLATGGPVVTMQIVGVVADTLYWSLREEVPPTVYTPLAQFYMPPALLTSMALSVRAKTGVPASLTKSVAAAVGSVNGQLPLTFRPFADQINASLAQDRFVAMLSTFFGALALLLAALGLYGVTAYAVSRRRMEIGIRMALGAAPAGIIRLVVSRVARLVGLGVLAGVGVSLWASTFVASLLYGLEPRDPATLIAAAVALGAVGMLAGGLPAWRASRVDPAVVLRES
jgi:putative ABC transport system permease protein